MESQISIGLEQTTKSLELFWYAIMLRVSFLFARIVWMLSNGLLLVSRIFYVIWFF